MQISGVKENEKENVAVHVMKRNNDFFYVRHVSKDLIDYYSVKKDCALV